MSEERKERRGGGFIRKIEAIGEGNTATEDAECRVSWLPLYFIAR